MSNRAVANVYRQVIDSTVRTSQADFEEMGIESAVLAELQRVWEAKLAASGVADFSNDSRLAELAKVVPSTSKTKREYPDSPNGKDEEQSRKAPRREESDVPPSGDDDAINSDLDDSDDDIVEEGGENGDIVIAMYDKVQRVKNKWKVHLKDGIVSVNGRDYLFNRCQGEFEW